jgi:hypothetical protein
MKRLWIAVALVSVFAAVVGIILSPGTFLKTALTLVAGTTLVGLANWLLKTLTGEAERQLPRQLTGAALVALLSVAALGLTAAEIVPALWGPQAVTIEGRTLPESAAQQYIDIVYDTDRETRKAFLETEGAEKMVTAAEPFDPELMQGVVAFLGLPTPSHVVGWPREALEHLADAEDYTVRCLEPGQRAATYLHTTPVSNDLVVVSFRLEPMEISNGFEKTISSRRLASVVVTRHSAQGWGETARDTWLVAAVVIVTVP